MKNSREQILKNIASFIQNVEELGIIAPQTSVRDHYKYKIQDLSLANHFLQVVLECFSKFKF